MKGVDEGVLASEVFPPSSLFGPLKLPQGANLAGPFTVDEIRKSSHICLLVFHLFPPPTWDIICFFLSSAQLEENVLVFFKSAGDNRPGSASFCFLVESLETSQLDNFDVVFIPDIFRPKALWIFFGLQMFILFPF